MDEVTGEVGLVEVELELEEEVMLVVSKVEVAESEPVDGVEGEAAFELTGIVGLKLELMDEAELPELRVTVEKPDHPLGR